VSHQAAFAAFFFTLGSGATVAFMFALDALFKAAHRLICACRTRPAPLAGPAHELRFASSDRSS